MASLFFCSKQHNANDKNYILSSSFLINVHLIKCPFSFKKWFIFIFKIYYFVGKEFIRHLRMMISSALFIENNNIFEKKIKRRSCWDHYREWFSRIRNGGCWKADVGRISNVLVTKSSWTQKSMTTVVECMMWVAYKIFFIGKKKAHAAQLQENHQLSTGKKI